LTFSENYDIIYIENEKGSKTMFPTFHFNIERWKYNPTFELYVSTKGRVRNKSKADIAPKILHNGYMVIYVYGSLNKYMLLHRVVMLTWRPTPEAEELTVDHKNHNKRDNSLDNLEWVTKEENHRRAREDEKSDLFYCDGQLVPKKEKKKKQVIGVRLTHQSHSFDFVSASHGEFIVKFQKAEGHNRKATEIWPFIEAILNGTNTSGKRIKWGYHMTAVYNDGTEANF
jgi:hypothetical protein